MGLLDILKELSQDNKDKKVNDKLFNDEADALGLNDWEKEDAKKSGLSPEEWLEAN